MKYVRVIDGIVNETIEIGDKDITTMFHADIISQFIQDPLNEAIIRGTWDGASFGPIPSISSHEQDLLEWKELMVIADGFLNQIEEDIISTYTTTQFNKLSQYTQDKYNEKVALRLTKPE